jgi:hypothetical protein
MLWTRYFIEGQGYNIEASILNQDNLSAILLEKNGRASSSKRTKHINVQYFFIKDRIASGELTVKHCPAAEMLADHFTKPLQGTLFRASRAEIQGIPIDMCDADLGWDRPCAINEQEKSVDYPSPQECVGTHKDCTYVGNIPKVLVPTIQGKDTKTVSLGATAGREPGGRRAAYPCSPTLVRRSYARVLKG